MRRYVQFAVCLWLLVSICGAMTFDLQDSALKPRGSGSGSRSPSPHGEGSGGKHSKPSGQGNQGKGKESAHPQPSGSTKGDSHRRPLHVDLNKPPDHATQPSQSHHAPMFLSHARPVHPFHPVQAHGAQPRHPLQTHPQRPSSEGVTTHLLSKQSAARLAASFATGSKRPAEASHHPQMDAKKAKPNWLTMATGKPARGPMPGTRPAWWNQAGGRPRRQSGTGHRYEEKKAYNEKQKLLKKQQQGFPPSEHHEQHPKPGGPRGPGSPGAGSHAVSKRRPRFE